MPITAEQARSELARRELERRGVSLSDDNQQIQQEQNPQEQGKTVADMLGGSAPVEAAAGFIDMTPIGLAKSIFNHILSSKPPSTDPKDLQAQGIDINDQENKDILDRNKKMNDAVSKYIPSEIPELGSGTAYNIGQGAGLVFGGPGAVVKKGASLAGKGVSKIADAALETKLASKLFPSSAVKNATKKVDDLLKEKTLISDKLYEPTNKVKDIGLYSKETGGISNDKMLSLLDDIQVGEDFSYTHLNPREINRTYYGDLKDLHNRFMENKTFGNAHDLQSKLGTEIRKFRNLGEKTPLDTGQTTRLNSLETARDILKSDMGKMLDKVSPGLSSKYDKASEYFANNTAKYQNLKSLLKGLGPNPKAEKTIETIEKAKHFGQDLPVEADEIINSIKKSLRNKKLAIGAGSLAGIGGGFAGYKLKDLIQ